MKRFKARNAGGAEDAEYHDHIVGMDTVCGEEFGPWTCTRPPNHEGLHEAGALTQTGSCDYCFARWDEAYRLAIIL